MIVPSLSVSSPEKLHICLPECLSPFPLTCLGSKDHSFIHVSRIPVSGWNARNAWRTGQSTVASSDIPFDVSESERWRESERENVCTLEKKERERQ